MDTISTYIPQDRRQALATGSPLPERTTGAALFADISGFTPLTEGITRALGPRQGAEELTRRLNAVYDALIAEVDRYGGSVLGFAGDAITCWFDERDGQPGLRAVACALAMQLAMHQFTAILLPDGVTTALALKTTIASGPARRFTVGDPTLQVIDTLAGATVARAAGADHLTHGGEVLVDAATLASLGSSLRLVEHRTDTETGDSFAVVASLTTPVAAHLRPETAQPLPLEQIRPWLLPAVYAREAAGLGAFLTEFRPVVALFLRFVGLDYAREEAGGQLDHFVRRAQTELANAEGSLLALTIGDKGSYFYAAFGAPVAHEDDARRAIKAALSLRQMAAEFDALAPVQIGVSGGTMLVGAYGGATRRTYGMLGDDVNLAARLMVQAAPGEIMVSGRVQQAINEEFACEPRLPVRVKGKGDPLPVFAVTGTLERRAIRLQEPDYALPMIGRRHELALIEQKLALAAQGHGQLVGITAEAGMGKSRLVAEVIRAARRRNFAGYGGACQSDGVNISYLVWWRIWRAFFDVDPAAPLRRQLRGLESELEDRAPERVEALPLLGTVMGLTLPANDFTQTLSPQDRKAALEALLIECLRSAAHEAGAEGGGLLFVLEDLHWIDPASYDLLEALAQLTVELPVLIVLAYRPPETARARAVAQHLEHLPNFTSIHLGELSHADAEQAIRAKLAQLFPERGGVVPPNLIERITTRAQGNPFYVEELLNYLRDRGFDPGNTAALAALDLPASLHSLILSRIDQLSANQQLTLKVASIIGRLFYFSQLHGYYPDLGSPQTLKDDLNTLAILDLTPLESPEPELTYLFKHIVTREVAYESLAFATRAGLHEQFAAYLEAHFALTEAAPETAQASPLLDVLAYHYDHSDNLPKRREYLRRAGEAAAARYANLDALDYLGRALALAPPSDLADRYRLRLAHEQVVNLLGDRETQLQDLASLEKLAADLGDPARRAVVALRRALYAVSTGDYPAAIVQAQAAIEFARAAGAMESEAHAHLVWGSALFHQADYDAATAQYQHALTLTRAGGLAALEADAVRSLGIVAERRSDFVAARDFLERSLELYRQTGDRRGESRSLNSLGVVAFHQSDHAAARTYYGRALHLKREIGDRHGEGVVLGNLGIVADAQNDAAAAQAYFEQCLTLCREIDDQEGIGTALAGLGTAALYLGDVRAAHTYFEQTLELAREIGDREQIGVALAALGNVHLALGDTAAAHTFYDQALELARAIGDLRQESSTLAKLGETARYQGDFARAEQHSRDALHVAEEARDLGLQADALTCLGRSLVAQAHFEQAGAVYRNALDLRRAMSRPASVASSTADLADATLRGGDAGQAAALAEEVLRYLETNTPDSMEEAAMYLAVYRALDAVGDSRATQVLARGYRRLHAHAAKLAGATQQHAYLEHVPAHRELVTAYNQLSTPASSA